VVCVNAFHFGHATGVFCPDGRIACDGCAGRMSPSAFSKNHALNRSNRPGEALWDVDTCLSHMVRVAHAEQPPIPSQPSPALANPRQTLKKPFPNPPMDPQDLRFLAETVGSAEDFNQWFCEVCGPNDHCGGGASLICCDGCPLSFHGLCLSASLEAAAVASEGCAWVCGRCMRDGPVVSTPAVAAALARQRATVQLTPDASEEDEAEEEEERRAPRRRARAPSAARAAAPTPKVTREQRMAARAAALAAAAATAVADEEGSGDDGAGAGGGGLAPGPSARAMGDAAGASPAPSRSGAARVPARSASSPVSFVPFTFFGDEPPQPALDTAHYAPPLASSFGGGGGGSDSGGGDTEPVVGGSPSIAPAAALFADDDGGNDGDGGDSATPSGRRNGGATAGGAASRSRTHSAAAAPRTRVMRGGRSAGRFDGGGDLDRTLGPPRDVKAVLAAIYARYGRGEPVPPEPPFPLPALPDWPPHAAAAAAAPAPAAGRRVSAAPPPPTPGGAGPWAAPAHGPPAGGAVDELQRARDLLAAVAAGTARVSPDAARAALEAVLRGGSAAA